MRFNEATIKKSRQTSCARGFLGIILEFPRLAQAPALSPYRVFEQAVHVILRFGSPFVSHDRLERQLEWNIIKISSTSEDAA